MAGVAGIAAIAAASPATPQSETASHVVAQPAASPGTDENTSDILVETLLGWGATHVFGIVGDGINPIVEALRKRQDRIALLRVRHDESAACMATAFAKHTGRLGVCLATTGPGAVHLMNGLYDAMYDNAPALAITAPRSATFRACRTAGTSDARTQGQERSCRECRPGWLESTCDRLDRRH